MVEGVACHIQHDLVGVVNGIPDCMLCLTSFLVLYSTTCGYVCRNNNLMDICQMFLLQIRINIYSTLNKKHVYFYMV